MRTIYLIRHGVPAFPDGERVCLSREDLHLSPEGQAQGMLLREYFSDIALQGVYSSEMARAKETAEFLSPEIHVVPDLRELGVGCWEGLTFREIRQRFPDLYVRRGEDPIRYGIPGGELPTVCRDRSLAALHRILEASTGDIAIVTHAGVNRILLCELMGLELKDFLKIPQPYGCINILHEDSGVLTAHAIGVCPD